MDLPFAPGAGIVVASIIIWLGVTVLTLLVVYWIIRLAVRHALRDAAHERHRDGLGG